MSLLVEFDYLTERFQISLDYYEKRAKESRNKFLAFQLIIIFTGAIIPVINLPTLITDLHIRLLSSVLGAIVVIATSLTQLLKSHETWAIYRSTANSLLSEKQLYVNAAGLYAMIPEENKRKTTFVERVEEIITKESLRFFAIHSQKESTK